jgi:prevent-host-death family protein
MTKLNIHEAKTHLSRYLKKVEAGETILLCKNGEPVAQITPLPQKKRLSILGAAKGLGRVTEKFFEPLTEEDLPGMGL